MGRGYTYGGNANVIGQREVRTDHEYHSFQERYETHKEGDPMSDHDQIVARHNGFISSYASENYSGMRDFVTENHVGMAPGRPQMTGRDESEAFWREGFETAKSAFTSHDQDLTVIGDWALDHFHFVMTIEPRDGGPKSLDEGKCLWVWRRENDGPWRVATAIWNSDSPAPTLESGG